jgi:6-phosphogluconolactonase
MKKAQINSWILAAVALSAAAANSGCGGGSVAPPLPPPAIAVVIVPAGPQTIDQGQSKNFTASVSNDSSNKGLNWALTQNGTACSPGCGTISPASTASGTPATYTAPAAINANLQFSVTATSVSDSTKSASDSTTAVPPPALNNPAQLPAAVVGQLYSYTLTESGGVPPFTWTITSGSLPPGLNLNSSTGVISGTPTVASAVVGTTKSVPAAQPNATPPPFTAQGCDSGNPQLCSSQAITILVNPGVGGTPDFLLSASPSSVTIAQGASGTSTISIATQNGFSGAVSLTASGLPTGVTASFSPVADNSSTLTLIASATSIIGLTPVTITGSSGNLSHTTTLSLAVTSIGSDVTITFLLAPPVSLATGASAQVSVMVSNDPTSGGADWAVSCGSADCGSLSPTHTASGATTGYTAPAAVPSGGNVTITVKATSKPSQSLMQVVNVTSEAAGNVPRFAYANDSGSISILSVDAFTGQLRSRGYLLPGQVSVTGDNPMILDRPGNFLYLPVTDANTSAPEFNGYKIDVENGSLTPLAGSPFSVGEAPLSSVVDPTGHYLFSLGYPTANEAVVQVLAIDQGTGALAEIPGSPFSTSDCQASDKQQILLHPSGKFLYILGSGGGNPLTCGYLVDAPTGKLAPMPGSPFPPVTADPTGVAMDPLGRFVFFGQNKPVGPNQGTPGVAVFAIGATGALSLVPGSPFLAPVPSSDNAWSITVDPDGKFLWLSTQYSDAIFEFSIAATGTFYPTATFQAPFNGEDLFVDPSGNFLYATTDQSGGSATASPNISVFSLAELALAELPSAPPGTLPLAPVDSLRVKTQPGATQADSRFFLTFIAGAASVRFKPGFSYVTNSVGNVSGYAMDPNTGGLTGAPGSPYGTGKMPASLAANLEGTLAYVANEADNSLTGYSINTGSGALSGISGSPFATGKGPIVAAVDPSGNFAYALDTQAQAINQYSIGATGILTSLDSVCGGTVNPGTAASSLAIEPAGTIAYVTDAGSNMLEAFFLSPLGDPAAGCLAPHNGALGSVATGTSPSSVAVHPSGNFVYASNSGSNDISAFAVRGIPPDFFLLVPVSGAPFAAGSSPVSVAVDPTGRFLYTANQNSNDVSAYTVNKLSGVLTPVAGSPFSAGTSPASLTADISGRFLYVADKGSNNVSGFSIDSTTGALTRLAASPFPAGAGPSSIISTGTIGDGPVPPPPPPLPPPPPPPPPGADFSVSITPASQDIVWGQDATYNVSVQPTGGFFGDVSVGLNNPPPGVTAPSITITIPTGTTSAVQGTLVINTSQAASSAGQNLLSAQATSGFLNHLIGFTLSVRRVPGKFTRIALLSPSSGGGTQTFSCNAKISAVVTVPSTPGAPFTVQFIRNGVAYPTQAVSFSGFLGFSPNCRVGLVVADASPSSSSPLGVYFFNLDFSVGATPIGGMINLTGSTYFWNDFSFSLDDSLLVMLGASGSGQTIDPNNPQPTNGAYVLDMLNRGNPGSLETFYGSGGYGAPVMACVDLLPSAGMVPANGCTPEVGTLGPNHPNQVRVTFAVNPGAPGTVQRDPNGNAELFLVPPF